MSLLKYFRQKQGVPDPEGLLSTSISPWAISLANREVQQELTKDKILRKEALTQSEYKQSHPKHLWCKKGAAK